MIRRFRCASPCSRRRAAGGCCADQAPRTGAAQPPARAGPAPPAAPAAVQVARRSIARPSGSAIASPTPSRSSARRGVDILLDDLAKEKLRLNGLDVVSSDSTTTTDASERTTYRLRYVLSDLPRRRAVAVDRAAVGALLRAAARASGCRTSRRPARCRFPAPSIAFRSTLPETSPTYGLRDGRAPAPRQAVLARAVVDRSGAGRHFARACRCSSRSPLLRRRTPARPAAAPRGRRRMDQQRDARAPALARGHDRSRTADAPTTRSAPPSASISRRRTGVPAPSLTAAEVDARARRRAAGRVPREIGGVAARRLRRGALRAAAGAAVRRRRAATRSPPRSRCSADGKPMRFLHPEYAWWLLAALRGRRAAEVARALAVRRVHGGPAGAAVPLSRVAPSPAAVRRAGGRRRRSRAWRSCSR